ncbi:MAG: hypothetical protein M3530_12070 [Thermoproteota archaeon]|nr:hypothetical protein [Thermoproteota archaeon]
MPLEYSLNNKPTFNQVTGGPGEAVNMIFQTISLRAITIIIESFNGSFSGQTYNIWVSNNKIEWSKIHELGLGLGNQITNSFSYNSTMNGPLFFKYVKVKVSVPVLGANIAARVTCSGR